MSRARREPAIDTGRALAAVVGAPVVALMLAAALVTFLPVDRALAFAIGAHAVIPLWVALAIALPLARSGARAWALCLAIALPLGLALEVLS